MGSDAVSPMLYPDVVSSVPFITSLFTVKVPMNKTVEMIDVYDYAEDLKHPWWSAILQLPRKAIGLFSSKDDITEDHMVNNFQLTNKENTIVSILRERISTDIDSKTSGVTVTVRMQDPLVSAILAATVITRLQEFITDYRTNKARQDLAYAEKLNDEAKQTYYEAQQRYAEYLDRNQGVVLHSVQTTRDRLENEADLAFNLYNQTAQRVQMAQAKVQETTPVFAIVSPATVPMRPSSPKKFVILLGFTVFATVVCGLWILFGDKLKATFKKSSKESEHNGKEID